MTKYTDYDTFVFGAMDVTLHVGTLSSEFRDKIDEQIK